jgi:hypothetical protein
MTRLLLSCLLLAAAPVASLAYDFSVDSASQEVPLQFAPGDVIVQNGGAVHIAAAQLGLSLANELDAFSYGKDVLRPVGLPNFYVSLEFSVSRGSVGNGGVVTGQVAVNGAAGDKFKMLILRNGRTIGPFIEADAPAHDLAPEPNQSNIDGLSWPPGHQMPVFFSVAPGVGLAGPADILFVSEPGITAPTVYATAAQLGLLPGDDIDALAIKDEGTLGVLDAGDIVYVSLTIGSPSRIAATGGPEAALQVVPGPIQVAVAAEDFDLSQAASEELDAMTGSDPGPYGATVPVCGAEHPPQPFMYLQGDLRNMGLGMNQANCVLGGQLRTRPLVYGVPGPTQIISLPLGFTPYSLHIVKGGVAKDGIIGGFNPSSGETLDYFYNGGPSYSSMPVFGSGDPIGSTGQTAQFFNYCGAVQIGNWPCLTTGVTSNTFDQYVGSWCTDSTGPFADDAIFAPGWTVDGHTLAGVTAIDGAPDPNNPDLGNFYVLGFTNSGDPVLVHVPAVATPTGVGWQTPHVVIDGSTMAPGGGFFSYLGNPAGGSSAAFHGFTTAGGEGIYLHANGTITTIADTATPVPGGVGTFSGFFDTVSLDESAVTFHAFLNSGTGIYTNRFGRLQKIAATGDVLDGSTVTNLNLARDAAAENIVLYSARLSDGRDGVFVKLLPVPFDTSDPSARKIHVDLELDPDPDVLGPNPASTLLSDLGTTPLQGSWSSNGTTGTITIPGAELERVLSLSLGNSVGAAAGSFGDWVIQIDIASGDIQSSSVAGTVAAGAFELDSNTTGGPWSSATLGGVPGTTAGYDDDAGTLLFCSDAYGQLGNPNCGAGGPGTSSSPPASPYDPASGFVHHPGAMTLGGALLWSGLGDQRWLEAAGCPDQDGDGVCDADDVCNQLADPGQEDTDGDLYGNACDCDFDNDGTCGIQDFNLFLPDFMSSTDSGVGTDMDGNGNVGIGDFNLFLPGFQAGAPGPSGLVP